MYLVFQISYIVNSWKWIVTMGELTLVIILKHHSHFYSLHRLPLRLPLWFFLNVWLAGGQHVEAGVGKRAHIATDCMQAYLRIRQTYSLPILSCPIDLTIGTEHT